MIAAVMATSYLPVLTPARIPVHGRISCLISKGAYLRKSSIKDLNGKTVGVQAGSALLARLPELGTMLEKEGGKLGKVVEYTSYPEAYQDLALGRVDYVVNTVINLKTLVAEKPAVFEIGQAVSGKSFPAWAVAKDNTELLAFLNEFIAKEKASGRFAELQKKWFGEAFPELPVAFEPEF